MNHYSSRCLGTLLKVWKLVIRPPCRTQNCWQSHPFESNPLQTGKGVVLRPWSQWHERSLKLVRGHSLPGILLGIVIVLQEYTWFLFFTCLYMGKCNLIIKFEPSLSGTSASHSAQEASLHTLRALWAIWQSASEPRFWLVGIWYIGVVREQIVAMQ